MNSIMMHLNYTLITDGRSDKTLMCIINWLLDDLYPRITNSGQYADFSFIKSKPDNGDVIGKINTALELYPSDVIFYHRDAESIDNKVFTRRMEEIQKHVRDQGYNNVVCVVPVTMMEAWLLIDELAIRKASGNTSKDLKDKLPAISRLEKIRDPKQQLHNLLKEASGLSGRRLNKFNVHHGVHLVSEYITDYSSLRNLSAFKVMEDELKSVINNLMK
jgi:hypothetical protein